MKQSCYASMNSWFVELTVIIILLLFDESILLFCLSWSTIKEAGGNCISLLTLDLLLLITFYSLSSC